MNSIYHTLRKNNPESARLLVREILKKNNYNVSKTAKILSISRQTVRRARDGTLSDLSRKPKHSPNRIKEEFENLILKEAKRTHFGYRLLSSYIYRKYGIRISENTIKAILKRNRLKPKKIKTSNGNRRRLYDYEHLRPFVYLQVDTKHILDKSALPKDVYNHILKYNLPIYEWNAIDVKTRMRFTAYSHSLSAVYGLAFLMLVVLWLRVHNVKEKINIRLDNGSEFCSGSKRKLNEYNELFSILNAEIEPIPPGAKHLQAIVENSHRKDDEYFFSIYPERCKNNTEFIQRAQSWQDTWNLARPHFGIDMNGLTPFEKFKRCNTMISDNIARFPTLLLEHFLGVVSYPMEWLRKYLNLYIISRGGKYVYAWYLFIHFYQQQYAYNYTTLSCFLS
jgi:transposase